MNKTQLEKEKADITSDILKYHRDTLRKGLGSVGEIDWDMSRTEDLAYMLGQHDILKYLINKEKMQRIQVTEDDIKKVLS